MLFTFDFSRKIFFNMDGSKSGLGFMLYQHDEDNIVYIITTDSIGVNDWQKYHPPIKLEALAVQFGIKKTNHWLRGCPEVVIITDCSGLQQSAHIHWRI